MPCTRPCAQIPASQLFLASWAWTVGGQGASREVRQCSYRFGRASIQPSARTQGGLAPWPR
eukprot:6139168-Alexandrium_andersonii.AAC.1